MNRLMLSKSSGRSDGSVDVRGQSLAVVCITMARV